MTPNDLIGDIKEEVDSWMEYHKGQYVKASSIYDKLQQQQF
jgi:predicted DNA-binding transcriptional regulator AlpA